MRYYTTYYYALGLLGLLLTTSERGLSQSIIGASSGGAVVTNQFHAWSVGEMCAISSQTVGSLTVTQGFLQPLIGVVSTKDETDSFFSQLSVFPNPTASILNIKGTYPDYPADLRLGLWDSRGVLLWEMDGADTEPGVLDQTIDLKTYPAGTYLLTIQNIQKSSTFIITKL
jgi:hypothetical protein